MEIIRRRDRIKGVPKYFRDVFLRSALSDDDDLRVAKLRQVILALEALDLSTASPQDLDLVTTAHGGSSGYGDVFCNECKLNVEVVVVFGEVMPMQVCTECLSAALIRTESLS